MWLKSSQGGGGVLLLGWLALFHVFGIFIQNTKHKCYLEGKYVISSKWNKKVII